MIKDVENVECLPVLQQSPGDLKFVHDGSSHNLVLYAFQLK
ncbi:hypothetical protein OROGR_006402 [Orobanche gracilis]